MSSIIAAAAARRSSAVDADVQDFFDRVAANSGTLSSGTQAAVLAFVAAAKSHGYWSQLNRINLVCGDWSAAQVPLIVGAGFSVEGNVGFASGDYSQAMGLKGNGSSKYWTTGYNPLAAGDTKNSFGLFVYTSGVETVGSSRVLIGHNSATTYTLFGLNNSGTSQSGCLVTNGANDTLAPSDSNAPADGSLGVVTNDAGSNQRYYRNGAPVGSTVFASGSTTHVNNAIYVGARNNNGSPDRYALAPYIRAYAITRGLTSTQVADFSADLNAFQTSLGRNVY